MPSAPSPKRVTRDQHQYFVAPDIDPVLEIESGEEVIVETVDCFSGAITRNDQTFDSVTDLFKVVTGLNAVSGPIAVRGAEAGDVLRVEILDIKVGMINGQAATTVFKDFGGLCNPYSIIEEIGPETKVCQIRDNVIEFPLRGHRKMVELPVKPMIGTIWSAPAAERRMSYVYDVHNCGNVDCHELGAGRSILLPVHVQGGMISLGDVHACMGHGEITGVAMETAGDVHIRIELIKARDSDYLLCPQIECTRTVGSVGCHFGRPLGENVRSAYRDMVNRMVQFHQFDRMDAYQLLGQVGEVVVHQTLDDWNAVLVKVDRKYLA